jgi:hypothetical protein
MVALPPSANSWIPAVAVQFHLGRRTTPIREPVTPRTLRYTCIASQFAAGADQDYVVAQVGHEDVATTNRIYRYVRQRRQRGEIGRRRQLAMRESVAEIGRPLFPGTRQNGERRFLEKAGKADGGASSGLELSRHNPESVWAQPRRTGGRAV